MKINLLLSLSLFAFACNNISPTDVQKQVNNTTDIPIKNNYAADTTDQDSFRVIPGNGLHTFEIELGQVGNIRKGMATGELFSLFDSTQIQVQYNKHNGYTYAIYHNSDDPAIICTSWNGKAIDGIKILGTAYKTGKGVGVGNTFADLTKAYHVEKVQADKDFQVYVWVEELQRKQYKQGKEEVTGILFEMGFDASDLLQESGTIPASAIPPDAKIVGILL